MIETPFITYLPLLLLAAGLLLLLPAPLLAAHRMSAAISCLALLMGGLFIQLVWRGDTALVSLFLIPTMALLIAAPLFERTRFLGLIVAALAGSVAVSFGIPQFLAPNLPARPALSLLPIWLIIALVIGMIGGIKLPLHPQRYRADGSAVWHAAPQAAMLAGWICLALAFVFLCGPETLGMSHINAALVAGLFALLHAQRGHGQDALQKAGEGIMAGLLMVLLVPLTPLAASAAGLVAGYFVTRSESIAISLRLDDPHHFLGALLIPSMLGLLMPGIADLAALASAVKWLGGAMALALIVSLILWPLTMFLLGMALPPRLVREGVQPR